MCCPQQDVPGQLNAHSYGRHLQRQLSKSANVSSRRVDISKAALEAQTEIWEKVAQLSCVVGFDNWYLKRYHSDPVVSRTSIDVAALTVFYLGERSGRHTLPFWHGQIQRGLPCSRVRLEAVARELYGSFGSLREGVKTFLDMDVGVKDIRVPLDVQRESQVALRWQPF